MLYEKKNDGQLTAELFKSPTSEFRGFPFWAWNGAVDDGEVVDQVDIFKEMGFGGFYMHVRQGLETEYLGPGFMKAVRDCVDKAKDLGLYACLYDEDRWPSGCAGGMVTKDIRYRARYLLSVCSPLDEYTEDPEVAYREGVALYLASFRPELGEDGRLNSYAKCDHEDGEGMRRFYLATQEAGMPRFNYQTYVDTMSREAIDKFIEITHESYYREDPCQLCLRRQRYEQARRCKRHLRNTRGGVGKRRYDLYSAYGDQGKIALSI